MVVTYVRHSFQKNDEKPAAQWVLTRYGFGDLKEPSLDALRTFLRQQQQEKCPKQDVRKSDDGAKSSSSTSSSSSSTISGSSDKPTVSSGSSDKPPTVSSGSSDNSTVSSGSSDKPTVADEKTNSSGKSSDGVEPPTKPDESVSSKPGESVSPKPEEKEGKEEKEAKEEAPANGDESAASDKAVSPSPNANGVAGGGEERVEDEMATVKLPFGLLHCLMSQLSYVCCGVCRIFGCVVLCRILSAVKSTKKS